jgi:hypothetical protein
MQGRRAGTAVVAPRSEGWPSAAVRGRTKAPRLCPTIIGRLSPAAAAAASTSLASAWKSSGRTRVPLVGVTVPAQVDSKYRMLRGEMLELRVEERTIAGPAVKEDQSWLIQPW